MVARCALIEQGLTGDDLKAAEADARKVVADVLAGLDTDASVSGAALRVLARVIVKRAGRPAEAAAPDMFRHAGTPTDGPALPGR